MKQFLPFFKFTLFPFFLLIVGNWSAQTNFVARPATFVAAKKSALFGSMSEILDAAGSTGLSSSGSGPVANKFVWNQSENPVTFSINRQASSTVSKMIFYGSWGDGENIKNLTHTLYNGTTPLGTEYKLLPENYNFVTMYLVFLSQKYSNVTKMEFTVVDDYGLSTASPKRVS